MLRCTKVKNARKQVEKGKSRGLWQQCLNVTEDDTLNDASKPIRGRFSRTK